MTNEKNYPAESVEASVTSHGSLLGTLSWRLLGPVLLIATLFLIAKTATWFHVWDLAFVGTLVLMIGGRYIDQRSGNGRTIYDEPSTWRHFNAYARNLVILGLVLWFAVKTLTVA